MMDSLIIELKVLLLIIIANGAPLFGPLLLGSRMAWPIDSGLRWGEQRLFGAHTTYRGVLLAMLITPLSAAWLGLPLSDGGIIAATAMIGDMLSSFLKRRLNIGAGEKATGLDQLPESLLPLLAIAPRYEFTLTTMIVLSLAFMLFDMLVSRLLYRLHLRDQPH